MSIVLNGARIGANCLIGAHALIPEGKVIPDGSVVMGSPGKIVRQVTEQDKQLVRGATQSYVKRWPRYAAKLKTAGVVVKLSAGAADAGQRQAGVGLSRVQRHPDARC